ncbi:MAG: anti-sigma factor antagonist, partial [Planctomycetota bacterium]
MQNSSDHFELPALKKGESYIAVKEEEIEGLGKIRHICCAGDLNIQSVSQLESKIEDALALPLPLMVFDFSHLNYINSSGMGALVKASDRAKAKGGFLCIVGLPEKIEGLFRMLGLTSSLDLFDSFQSAIQFLKEEKRQPASPPTSAPSSTPSTANLTKKILSKTAKGPSPANPASSPTSPTPSTPPSSLPMGTIFDVYGLQIQRKEDFLCQGQSFLHLELIGALDTRTCAKFDKKMQEIVQQGHRFIILDFSRIDYVNSSGMGVLIKIHDQLSEQNGLLLVAKLSLKLQELFNMLGISQAVHLISDLEEAASFLPKSSPPPPQEEIPPPPTPSPPPES